MKNYKSIFLRLSSLAFVGYSVLSCSGNESAKFSVSIGTSTAILIPAKAPSCKEQIERIDDSFSISANYFNFYYPSFSWTGDADFNVNLVGINLKINSPSVGGTYQCLITGDDLNYLYYNQTISGSLFSTTYWNPLSLGKVDTGTSTIDGRDKIYYLKNTDYWTTDLDTNADGTIDVYVPDSLDSSSTTNSSLTAGAVAAPNVAAPVLYTQTLDRGTKRGYSGCPIRCGGVQSQAGDRFTVPVTIEVTAIARRSNSDGTVTEIPYKASTTASLQQLF